MQIIDIHTHAFPDFLAEKAIDVLSEHSGEYKPFLNGKISSLLNSMDKSNIKSSVVANIATKPEQADSILKWSKEIMTDRIIPLGSIHPDSLNWKEEIDNFIKIGIKGIKFHSMYQNFMVDEKRMFKFYDYISENNLFILFHAGYDIAFPGDKRSSSEKFVKILNEFPNLKVIAAHFGGWKDWENVILNLCGKNIYFDTSFLHEISNENLKKIFTKHDDNKILFGSDSPWLDQDQQIQFIYNLSLINSETKEKILYRNFNNLIKI